MGENLKKKNHNKTNIHSATLDLFDCERDLLESL